jgi:3-hydroxyacyl-[acyl-carrier-protein] dehydratase
VVQSLGERNGQIARLCTVRSLRLLVPLYPGDELSFEACVADPVSAEAVVVTAEGRRGDGVRVATMTLECGWSP